MKRLTTLWTTSILAGTMLIAGAAPAAAQGAGDVKFVATLRGDTEVPARVTDADGFSEVVLDVDDELLSFRLEIETISNAFQAHIHVGATDVAGPVVVFLFGPEPPGGGFESRREFTGTATAADFVGPLAGQPFSALVENMTAGNTYVNVHTNDGVDPADTGPGDFPGGEIRGQLIAACAAEPAAEARSDGDVLLSWETVPLAREFQIFRRDAGDETFERIATVEGTSFLDDTAVAGRTFEYVVQASDGRLDKRECDDVLAITAVPVFPSLAAAIVVAAAGAIAFGYARRR